MKRRVFKGFGLKYVLVYEFYIKLVHSSGDSCCTNQDVVSIKPFAHGVIKVMLVILATSVISVICPHTRQYSMRV